MTQDQSRLRRRAEVEYVTRNFAGLQGLRIVPWAVAVAVWSASEAQLLTGTVYWTLFGASLVIAAVATPMIGRWYSRRYGTVEPRRRVPTPTRVTLMAIALKVVLVSGAVGWMPEVETISVPGLVLGVALVTFAWVQGPAARRIHPWIHRFGAALAFISVLPLDMLTEDPVHPLSVQGVMPILIALFLIISAIDSHRALDTLMAKGRKA